MEKGQTLIDYMDANGIDKAVVNTINTLVNSRNIGANKFTNKLAIKNFAEEIRGPDFEIFKEFRLNGQPSHEILLEQVKKHPKRLIPFFWYNPSDLDQKIGLKTVTDKLRHEGFRGVKLQLAMTPCDIEQIFPVAQVCVDFDVPISIHPSPGVFSVKRTDAFSLLKLAKNFPTLKLIILHAVYTMEFYVEMLIALKSMPEIKNVYFETSCSILYGILELIKIFGADRVLFGSDSPTATPFEPEYYKIASLRIPKEDKSKILGGNIKRLLNIES
jgi:predicted TIM-barrel fold metal-dependent hydrolase